MRRTPYVSKPVDRHTPEQCNNDQQYMNKPTDKLLFTWRGFDRKFVIIRKCLYLSRFASLHSLYNTQCVHRRYKTPPMRHHEGTATDQPKQKK